MAISQLRSKRKSTGAKYVASRKKKLYELGRRPTMTSLANKRIKRLRVRGGNTKELLLSAQEVNVMDPKTNKSFKVSIEKVIENPANRNYVRRSILTKGAVITTSKGKARITSRPGQEATINAVLIDEEWLEND